MEAWHGRVVRTETFFEDRKRTSAIKQHDRRFVSRAAGMVSRLKTTDDVSHAISEAVKRGDRVIVRRTKSRVYKYLHPVFVFVIDMVILLYVYVLLGRYSWLKNEYAWWDNPDYLPSSSSDNLLERTELEMKERGRYSKYLNIHALIHNNKGWPSFLCAQYLFGSRNIILTESSYRFLKLYILSRRLHRDKDGKQRGIVTNKHLCRSILLLPDEGDEAFDAWYKRGQQRRDEDTDDSGSLMLIDAEYPAKFKRLQCGHGVPTCGKGCNQCAPDYKNGDRGLETCCYIYFRLQATTKDGTPAVDAHGRQVTGLWPLQTDTQGWMGIVLDWLNFDNDGIRLPSQKQQDWIIVTESNAGPDGGDMNYPYFRGDAAHQATSLDNWHKRADNFVARMGMTPLSPMVLFFINNKYSHRKSKGDVAAFRSLVHAPEGTAGGWVGFCLGIQMPENAQQIMSTDMMMTFCWSDLDVKQPDTTPACPAPPSPWTTVGSIALGLVGAIAIVVPPFGTWSVACGVLAAASMAGTAAQVASSYMISDAGCQKDGVRD